MSTTLVQTRQITYYLIAVTAILVGLAVKIFHPDANAIDTYQMSPNQPNKIALPETQTTCPAAATVWCRDLGGFPE